MEVPYMSKLEEEENGVNLQTKRKSKSLLHQNISNSTSSNTSVLTSETSNTSLENYTNVTHKNKGSNRTTSPQKGLGVIEPSISEINEGDKETNVVSNTDAKFRDVASLNRVTVTPSEVLSDTDNTLRQIVVWNDQGEVVETSYSKDIEPTEYQVESVVKNQNTHDIICPNCQHCITDRVILKRRKRKSPEPKEGSSDDNEEEEDEPVEAISCFRIFIPTGNGFLSWFIKPKPNVTDGTSPGGPEHNETEPNQDSPQTQGQGIPDVSGLEPPPVPRPGVSGPDIIKAIVYGGLVECISSLSVITSAAGGDATTLNIVALGLANVAGGLFLLLHNLRVLIQEQHTTDGNNEYQLGRRDHFLRHTVVAVISYLVFGLLSPVIYGFTFRKSDNKDYKLATLAAASLVCITILSVGKAYALRQAYIKTIIYYLSVGFMVSGVGYVAGDLINTLLKKLGVFDASAPVAMPGLEAEFVNRAWSSY